MTTETIFCTQCGARNPVAARFCDQCGAALVKPGAAATSTSAVTLAVPVNTSSAATQAAAPAAQPVGSVVCSQCGIAALPGEAFCDNCGAALSAPGALTPQPVYPPPQPTAAAPVSQTTAPVVQPAPPAPAVQTAPAPAAQPVAPVQPAPPAPAARTTLAPARLQVEGNGATLTLPASASALLGRADPSSNFYPDIDLGPYGALEQGVGRRHLRLTLHQGQLNVEDLDSTNGTAVNGQKLPPRQPRTLAVGDVLLVGRMALRLLDS